MSLRCGDANAAGLQRAVYHWFVHAYVYSRSGRSVARSVPTVRASLLFQLWTANELLPSVVKVDAPVRGSTSHGFGDAGLPTTWVQPAVASQHHVARVSVAL